MILCAASAYEQKYYLDPAFMDLPQDVKDELQSTCVLFTEEVGGVLVMEFDEEDGTLFLSTQAAEEDILYDEIGAGLKIRQIREEKADLFESLELYYRIFFGRDPHDREYQT